MIEGGPKGSSYDKIIAPEFSEEARRSAMDGLAESYENPPIDRNELEKTPEEEEIIRLANEITSNVIKSLGLQPLNVPEKSVKVVLPGTLGGDGITEYAGQFVSKYQVLYTERRGYNLESLRLAIHEMFHMKSYGALQTVAGDEQTIDFDARSGFGLNSRDGTMHFFDRLNEAVTESLTKTALQYVIRDRPPVLEQELTETEQAKRSVPSAVETYGNRIASDEVYLARLARHSGEQNIAFSHVYNQERKAFDNLIAKIYQQLSGAFESEGGVREQFYLAYFSGNLRVVAQMIDGTFGKGAFRRIGEAQSADEFEQVIRSL